MEPEVSTSMDGLINMPAGNDFVMDVTDGEAGSTPRHTVCSGELAGVKVDRIVMPLEGGGLRLLICRYPFADITVDGRLNPLFHTDVPAAANKADMDNAWFLIEKRSLEPGEFQIAGMPTPYQEAPNVQEVPDP